MSLYAELDKNGRLLIPYPIRKKLNYKKGSKFVIHTIDDELHIISIDKILQEAQALIRDNASSSSVDDFLQMRREEYNQENS